LINWQQSDHGVAGPPSREGVTEARDPYVFSFGDHRYAVQGAGAPDGEPLILLYECDDLERWTEQDPLLDYSDPVAREVAKASIWECPNLFPLDGRWVLIISSWHRSGLVGSHYLIGDLEPLGNRLRFVAEAGGDVDTGQSWYAPQVLSTPDRALLGGWARDVGRSAEHVAASGWAGALTFPRELSIRDGRLVSAPAAELDVLRGRSLPADQPISGHRFELRASAGLRLRLSGADHDETVIEEPGAARVFVDGSMIEIFRAGETVETVRAYPAEGSRWQAEGVDLIINELGLPSQA
jgi:beta-fructofuranosidase